MQAIFRCGSLGVDVKILDVLRPALRPSHDLFQVASKLFADAAVWHPQRLARPLDWSFLGFHRATRASGRFVQSASKGSAAFLWSPMSSESTLTVEEQVLRERRQYGNPNMPPLTLEVKIHPRERGGVRIDEWNRQVRHQEQRSRVLVAASETERRLEEDPEHLTRRKAASGRERILEEICRTSALGTKLTSK